jgi:hypothetical protein
MATEINTEKLDFEKVWSMFQETDKQFKETDKQFKETDKQFKETKELLAKSSLETDRKIQESDIKLKKIQEATSREFNKLMKKLSEIETRWGKFVEALVDGTLVAILNERGIEVQQTTMRSRGKYKTSEFEIDVIAKNGHQVVAVEVKTTLSVNDVKRFLKKLEVFKEVFNQYSGNQIIGAVGYISVEEEANRFAARNGLFVIKATNNSAKIINKETFKPKLW